MWQGASVWCDDAMRQPDCSYKAVRVERVVDIIIQPRSIHRQRATTERLLRLTQPTSKVTFKQHESVEVDCM